MAQLKTASPTPSTFRFWASTRRCSWPGSTSPASLAQPVPLAPADLSSHRQPCTRCTCRMLACAQRCGLALAAPTTLTISNKRRPASHRPFASFGRASSRTNSRTPPSGNRMTNHRLALPAFCFTVTSRFARIGYCERPVLPVLEAAIIKLKLRS